MRTVPTMYILNLTTKYIILLTVHFFEMSGNKISVALLHVEIIWHFLPFCRRLSVGLSANSVAVLFIQRCRVTVNPLHVHVSAQPTWHVTVATVFGVWIVAGLFTVLSPLSKYLCHESMKLRRITYYKPLVFWPLWVFEIPHVWLPSLSWRPPAIWWKTFVVYLREPNIFKSTLAKILQWLFWDLLLSSWLAVCLVTPSWPTLCLSQTRTFLQLNLP